MTALLGATVGDQKTGFAVRSPHAAAVDLCLFDGEHEARHDNGTPRRRLVRGDSGGFDRRRVTGSGQMESGLRTGGFGSTDRSSWSILIRKSLTGGSSKAPSSRLLGGDTARIVPRAIVPARAPDVAREPPFFAPGGLIYELNVRAFTILHPDVPEGQRGTVAALAHPAILAHLRKLRVSAIELMPIVAWIDERHLPPLGLVNSWGYNPVVPMALDPGLCPGGIVELRETVAALHSSGIGVILDIVLNHTGESDVHGGTLSLRGLDNDFYAHELDRSLVSFTGTGNTLDFANPDVRTSRPRDAETLRSQVRNRRLSL